MGVLEGGDGKVWGCFLGYKKLSAHLRSINGESV